MDIEYNKIGVQIAYGRAAKEYIFNTMSPSEMLNNIVRMGLQHKPMGSDAHLRAILNKGIRDQECLFEFCETYDITPPQRHIDIQNKKVKSLDDIFEQDKPENGGQGLLEDKNTVNCYFCQKEMLDRDAMPADEYNGADGGSICGTCLKEAAPLPSPSPSLKSDQELINFALEFLNVNLSEFEVMQLTGCNSRFSDETKNDFYEARDNLREKIESLKTAVVARNELQLREFPDYDNTTLFIRLLELLKPQGFTDGSWHNDELPSMISTKFVVHVSYSVRHELNEDNETYIGLIHLDEDECVTGKTASFKTIEELTKYLENQEEGQK